MGLVWSDITRQAALSTTLAMAWEEQGSHSADGAVHVAAALQRGDSHIDGWHYDADHHGFPSHDDDDEDW